MSTMGSRYDDENQGVVKPKPSKLVKKIFGFYYRCRVPQFASRTKEEIAQNGLYVSGIKSIDDAEKNAWVLRDMTIAGMLELYARGVSFTVVNYSDTKDIFDTIEAHLRQWLEVLRTGMNINSAPIEDLLMMDKFASSIYPHAKFVFTKDAIENAMGQAIQDSQRVTLHNFFSKVDHRGKLQPISPAEQEKKKEEIPERESLASAFRESMTAMRRW